MKILKKCITYTIAILLALLALYILFRPVTVISFVSAEEEQKPLFITPELKAICGCESVGDWNTEPIQSKNGKLLRGKVDPRDVGACQINEHYWLKESKNQGLNIYWYTDNVRFANYLYETYGSKPWNASKSCWDKPIPASRF